LFTRFSVRQFEVPSGSYPGRLAELAGVELRTEQKWESGEINPPLTTLVCIQEIFGCKWDELLGEAKSEPRKRHTD